MTNSGWATHLLCIRHTIWLSVIKCYNQAQADLGHLLTDYDHQQNKLKIVSTYKRLQSPQAMQVKQELQALIMSYQFSGLQCRL